MKQPVDDVLKKGEKSSELQDLVIHLNKRKSLCMPWVSAQDSHAVEQRNRWNDESAKHLNAPASNVLCLKPLLMPLFFATTEYDVPAHRYEMLHSAIFMDASSQRPSC